MTKLELKINGQPFEVELHDGVQVSIEKGKLTVSLHPMPSIPFSHYRPAEGWRTGTITVSVPEDNAGWTIVPIQ